MNCLVTGAAGFIGTTGIHVSIGWLPAMRCETAVARMLAVVDHWRSASPWDSPASATAPAV